MNILDEEKFFAKLEEMGKENVRLKLAQGIFSPQKKNLVSFWLSKQKKNNKR